MPYLKSVRGICLLGTVLAMFSFARASEGPTDLEDQKSQCYGDFADETCEVSATSVYFNKDEKQYYVRFKSKCSRPVQITCKNQGVRYSRRCEANSNVKIAVGRTFIDQKFDWDFDIL